MSMMLMEMGIAYIDLYLKVRNFVPCIHKLIIYKFRKISIFLLHSILQFAGQFSRILTQTCQMTLLTAYFKNGGNPYWTPQSGAELPT
jgi:hypothetical protein